MKIGIPVHITNVDGLFQAVVPVTDERFCDGAPLLNGLALTFEELKDFAAKCYEFSGMGTIDHISEAKFMGRVEKYLRLFA